MTPKPITIQNLFKLYLQRKFSIFLKILILLILLIIFSFIMPHKFISESTIMPSSSKGSSGGLAGMLSNVSSSYSFGSIGGDDKSLLFSEILKSRSVADFVIKDIELDKHPYFNQIPYPELIDFIRYSVDTDVLKSGVTSVNFSLSTKWFPSNAESDSIAILTAMITNSAIDGLNHVLLNQSMSSAKESRKYIKLEIDSHTQKLDSLEKSIQKFQEQNNVLEITEQTSTMAQQGLDIAKELSVSELEYEIAKKVYSDNSPQLTSFKEKYQILQEQYGKAQKGGLIPTDKFALPVDSIPRLIRVYYDLMRQREIMEHVLVYLQTQYYQEAIQEKKDVSEVEVLDEAEKPYKRAAPVRSVMMILGGLLIVIFVLTYEAFAAYFKGQIFIENID